MKNIKIGFVLLASISIAVSSCTEDDKVILNPSAAISPAASESNVVLAKEEEGTDALTIHWPDPGYGFSASPTNIIYFDKEDGDFSAAIAVNVGKEMTKTFKTEELNKLLLDLQFIPGESAGLKFKVESKLGTYRSLQSEVVNISATPYASFLDLSTSWGVVGSGYNNWGQFPDAPFYATKIANVIVAYVALKDGEIKFRENNAWTNNLGDNGGDGILENDGANIPVTAGNYKITFNTATKVYSIEEYSWGIVGSAYNDWGATPDFNFYYDDATDQWRAIVQLKDGEFKIRKNSDWGINYGDDGADGTLESGGANIAVTAGKYEVTFNENDLTIEIAEIPSIWGLVGSAYNNWGATPDASFIRDYRSDGLWVLRNVTLQTGEFKFRDSNDWGTNYGDTGGDGTLELNGDNIVSAEGVYTITLDFSNPESPTWTSVKH